MAANSSIHEGAAEITGTAGVARIVGATRTAETSTEETNASMAASTAREPGKPGAATGGTGTAWAGREARMGREPGKPGARTGATGIAGEGGVARKAQEPATPGTARAGTITWGADEVTIMEGPGWDSGARKPGGSGTARWDASAAVTSHLGTQMNDDELTVQCDE
ncbi:uncharacterized protein [Macrobrachium rosenbergii]|uniref:uncharacterized protein n=1 Tax=Macrobrachium rosenbergii TaxID=79674 RepID=UPI0034D3EAB9